MLSKEKFYLIIFGFLKTSNKNFMFAFSLNQKFIFVYNIRFSEIVRNQAQRAPGSLDFQSVYTMYISYLKDWIKTYNFLRSWGKSTLSSFFSSLFSILHQGCSAFHMHYLLLLQGRHVKRYIFFAPVLIQRNIQRKQPNLVPAVFCSSQQLENGSLQCIGSCLQKFTHRQ